jgi:hypothetical protein
VIFIGMARYLCQDPKVSLTWPVDEMTTLDVASVSLLFAMLRDSGIKLFGAVPTRDTNFQRHFDTRVALDFKRGAGVMSDQLPNSNQFSARLQQTGNTEAVSQ